VFCDPESQWDAPCCDNFQWVPAQTSGLFRDHDGKICEAVPVRVDNYTYDVIRVCNACDEILRPVAETSLPERLSLTY